MTFGDYNLFSYCREFGINTLAATSITRVARRLHLRKDLIAKLDSRKYSFVVDWIKRSYPVDDSRVNDVFLEPLSSTSPFWVFWWQGENDAPLVVKRCIESIRNHAGQHPVRVLSKNNFLDYVSLPETVIQKVDMGLFSVTFLSDILRHSLMSQQGGLWLDSTLLLTSEIPSSVYEMPYFSLSGTFDEFPWTDFLQGSGKSNPFTTLVADILQKYSTEHNQLITYLTIDCAMKSVYESSDIVKEMVDRIPCVDRSIFELNDKLLDLPYDDQAWDQLKRKTFAHKLSYKFPHSCTSDGQVTFWGKLLNEGGLP